MVPSPHDSIEDEKEGSCMHFEMLVVGVRSAIRPSVLVMQLPLFALGVDAIIIVGSAVSANR